MTNINKLFKESDVPGIFAWLSDNRDNKSFKNYLNRYLNILLDNKDIENSIKLFETFNINPTKTNDKQLGILLIRYNCMIENPDIALSIYDNLGSKNRRKRHLSIIINTLVKSKDYETAYSIFQGFLVNQYPIDVEDLVMFWNTEFIRSICEEAISFDLEVPHVLVQPEDRKTPSSLNKFSLTEKEKNKLLESIGDQFEKKNNRTLFDNFISNIHTVDIVIDGANVLFYGDRSITPASYIRLDLVIREFQNKNILVVLHERHFNIRKQKWSNAEKKNVNDILNEWKKKDIFYKTPRNFNDDWYAIIAGIIGNSYILTNDNFNDHVFGAFDVQRNGRNVFRRWKTENGVFYRFKNNNKVVEFDFPKTYSNEIQKIEDEIYVPLTNGEWVVF